MTTRTRHCLVLAALLVLGALGCGDGLKSAPGLVEAWAKCGTVGGLGIQAATLAGDVLVLLDTSRHLHVYELPATSPRMVISVPGPIGDSNSIEASPDGTTVAVNGYGAITLWSLQDGSRVGGTKQAQPTARLRWSPDGHWLASMPRLQYADSGQTAAVSIWRIDNDQPLTIVPASLAGFAADGSAVVFWEPATRDLVRRELAGNGAETDRRHLPLSAGTVLDLSPDGSLALIRTADAVSTTAIVRTSDAVPVCQGISTAANSFSRDGRTVVSTVNEVSPAYKARWSAIDCQRLSLPLDNLVVATAPDGTLALTGAESVDFQIVRGDFAPVATVPLPVWGAPVTALAFTSDQRLLATASDRLRVWRTTDGALLWTADAGPGVTSLEFSGSGALLASAGPQADAFVWNVSDGTLARRLTDPLLGEHIYSVSFDHETKLIVGGPAGTPAIRAWRVDGLVELPAIQTNTLYAAASVADDSIVATSTPEVWRIDRQALDASTGATWGGATPVIAAPAPADVLLATAEGGDRVSGLYPGNDGSFIIVYRAGLGRFRQYRDMQVSGADVPAQFAVPSAGGGWVMDSHGTLWAMRSGDPVRVGRFTGLENTTAAVGVDAALTSAATLMFAAVHDSQLDLFCHRGFACSPGVWPELPSACDQSGQ